MYFLTYDIGHISLYLFATRTPVKCRYSLALKKALPPRKIASIELHSETDDHLTNHEGVVNLSSRMSDEQSLYRESDTFYECFGSTKSFGSPSEGNFISSLSSNPSFFAFNRFFSF